MQKKNTKLDFTGQEIYVGLDTGKKGWKGNELIRPQFFIGAVDESYDDPMFIVSNFHDGIGLLYRFRMRIEEDFIDMKSLFGFKHLVLKNQSQSRLESILALVIISMGIALVGSQRFDKAELNMVELHRDLRISAEVTSFLILMRRNLQQCHSIERRVANVRIQRFWGGDRQTTRQNEPALWRLLRRNRTT